MTDRSGQQLGNYRLVRLLGSGAFADVYLGEHIFLKTYAAVKILRTQVLQRAIDDFLTEAQTIAHLRNTNIVRVQDFGIDNSTGTFFLIMDYAPHGSLRQVHPQGSTVPLATIVSYVRQVAAALQHAHDQKLIHRDVKPENMLPGYNKEVILSDFGIAGERKGKRAVA
jgi:serine/threonine protein kinase